MYDVKISDAARNDIYDSSLWYNEQKQGLGTEFQREVFNTLKYIRKDPLIYSIRFSGKFHFAKANRFPFLIVYEITEDLIIINAVFHTSRNPAKF
jgi:plasmid stabilization system protein ParE